MQTEQRHTATEGTPLVSFIVPVFNVPADMLCECIESIMTLALQPEEREIIVIDDGSDKPCIDDINKYVEQLTYIRQKNSGLSAARNTGIKCASGTYLQFVDADDMLITSAYNHCLDIAKRESPDMVMFDFTNTPIPSQTFHDTVITDGTTFMRHHNLRASAWGYLFKRNMLGQLRFTPGLYHEDEEFTPLLLLRTGNMILSDAKAYMYRRRKNSITTSTDEDSQAKRLGDVRQVIGRLYNISDTLPPDEQQALDRRVAQLTMDFIYKVIVEQRSQDELEQQICELRQMGLFPLPKHDYTQKYQWFRRMTSTKMGRRLLLQVIPLMKRER